MYINIYIYIYIHYVYTYIYIYIFWPVTHDHVDNIAWHIFIENLIKMHCLGCKKKNLGQMK